MKEFAYFGFAITLVSAGIAHFSVGDAGRPPLYVFYILDPLFFLGMLVLSYRYFHKLRNQASAYDHVGKSVGSQTSELRHYETSMAP